MGEETIDSTQKLFDFLPIAEQPQQGIVWQKCKSTTAVGDKYAEKSGL